MNKVHDFLERPKLFIVVDACILGTDSSFW
jgi:hypothetical protein